MKRPLTGYHLAPHSLSLSFGKVVIMLSRDAWREAAEYLTPDEWRHLRPIVEAHFGGDPPAEGRR